MTTVASDKPMTEKSDKPTTLPAVRVQVEITSLDKLQEFCKLLAGTDMVPKGYQGKAGDILVAIMHGQEVGLPALQALQSIATINGVPSIYGDAALALVRRSGLLEDFDEWFEVDGQRQERPFDILTAVKDGKKVVAFCYSKRVNMRPRTTWYGVSDAIQAKLWMKKTTRYGKDGKTYEVDSPWVTTPARMLMWRCRGFNLRDNFGDVLKGLAIYEEAIDLEQTTDGTYAMTDHAGDGAEEPAKPAQASKAESILTKIKRTPTGGTIDAQAKTVEAEPPTKAEEPKPAEQGSASEVQPALPLDADQPGGMTEQKWKQAIAYFSDHPDMNDAMRDILAAKFAPHRKTADLPAAMRQAFLVAVQAELRWRQIVFEPVIQEG